MNGSTYNLAVDNGKYVFRTMENQTGVFIDRGPERDWVRIEQGSKAVVALLGEVEEAWQRIRVLESQLTDLQGQLQLERLGA